MKYVIGWGAIILFFGGLALGGFFLVKNVSTDVFSYKDVEELTYGDYDITDLVKQKVECKKNECTFKKKKVEFTLSEIKELGKQKLDLEIIYGKEKYNHTFEVDIVDKKAPEIVLSEKYAVLNVNSKWDAKSYVTSVTDNFDDLSIENIEIEDNVNANKIGDYEVTYKIKDSSGNEGKSILKVMIKDPKTKVEIPKDDTPSTPTVNEKEKFEAKISTTGIYDFNNTLNQDNKTGSVSKEITITSSATINFNFDLNGSGAYTVGFHISDKDEKPVNSKDFECNPYTNSSDCYKDTIDTNHKYSYTFREEGTYYVYIVLKDRMNNVTLEQKMKITIKASTDLTNLVINHSEVNGKEKISFLVVGGGSDLDFDLLDFDTDDERYYDDAYADNLVTEGNGYMLLDFKKGCYYYFKVAAKSGGKTITREITIQK